MKLLILAELDRLRRTVNAVFLKRAAALADVVDAAAHSTFVAQVEHFLSDHVPPAARVLEVVQELSTLELVLVSLYRQVHAAIVEKLPRDADLAYVERVLRAKLAGVTPEQVDRAARELVGELEALLEDASELEVTTEPTEAAELAEPAEPRPPCDCGGALHVGCTPLPGAEEETPAPAVQSSEAAEKTPSDAATGVPTETA